MAGIMSNLSDKWTGAKNTASNVIDNVGSGTKEVYSTGKELLTPDKQSGATIKQEELYTIGKPYAFNDIIDPKKRFGNFIRTKMSVIDLIPCECSIAFRKMEESVTNKTDEPYIKGGIFQVSYDKKIKEYQNLCEHHGLDIKTGIRLYTTDETTATDSVNIQYKNSFFQEHVDKLSSFARQIREIGRSINSNYDTGSLKFAQSVGSAVSGTSGSGTRQKIGELVSSVAGAVLTGNRISFPKIWENTTHTSNLSTVIKLVSPYGTPKSIYEFIIKPLGYLMLLSSAQTNDGVSYGNSIPITIKAYGMNFTTFGSINSITCRRGGSDTSFNIYRQPLTIDVSIDFQTLVDGFAVYTLDEKNKTKQPDFNTFSQESLKTATPINIYSVTPNSPLSTMSTFLESLKPVSIIDGSNDLFQVYGNFSQPDIDGNQISPGSMGGNLFNDMGNMMDTSTSFIDDISATLNSAVNTVGQITNSLSSYSNLIQNVSQNPLSNINNQVESIRNKIRNDFSQRGNL